MMVPEDPANEGGILSGMIVAAIGPCDPKDRRSNDTSFFAEVKFRGSQKMAGNHPNHREHP